MTYVDKDWGSGRAFLNLGFELTGERAANTYLVNKTSGKRTLLVEQKEAGDFYIKNTGSLKLEFTVNSF